MLTMMNSIRATFVLYEMVIEFSRFNTFCSYRSNCEENDEEKRKVKAEACSSSFVGHLIFKTKKLH